MNNNIRRCNPPNLPKNWVKRTIKTGLCLSITAKKWFRRNQIVPKYLILSVQFIRYPLFVTRLQHFLSLRGPIRRHADLATFIGMSNKSSSCSHTCNRIWMQNFISTASLLTTCPKGMKGLGDLVPLVEWRIFEQKYIRLVREKLRIFSYEE